MKKLKNFFFFHFQFFLKIETIIKQNAIKIYQMKIILIINQA